MDSNEQILETSIDSLNRSFLANDNSSLTDLLLNSNENSLNDQNNYLESIPLDEDNNVDNEPQELVVIDSTVADSEIVDDISGAAETIVLEGQADSLQLSNSSPDVNLPLESSVNLSLDYNVDLSFGYGDLIIESGVFEDNFDDYDFLNADGSELNFSYTESDVNFSSTNFDSIAPDNTLEYEIYDSDGEIVIVETEFTAVDYSFINNPQNINFDNDFYLTNYPEVASAGINPFSHYMQTGWREGKDPSPFFDTSFYLESHSDVLNDGINPLVHYNASGWKELRDPTPFFDTSYYLESNTDVLNNGINPLKHFENSGWEEGRNPNPFFQTNFYLNSNPRVRESGLNPLYHYISSGESEGRLPSLFFDDNYYLNKYTDVAQSGLNSLEHFLRSGYREGRLSNRAFESPDQVLIAQSVWDGAGNFFNPLNWILVGGVLVYEVAENTVEFIGDIGQSVFFTPDTGVIPTGTPPFPDETEGTIQVEIFPNRNIDDVLDSSIFTFPLDDEGEYNIFSNPSGEQVLENILDGGVFSFPGEEIPQGTYFLSIESGSPEWRGITNTTDRFRRGECADCAEQLQNYLERNGVSGRRIRLENGRDGLMYSDSLERQVTNNGYHEGVVVEVDGVETVFDNFHTRGLPLEEWLDDIFSNPSAEVSYPDSW